MFRKRPQDPCKVFGFTCVTFGDITAGLMLEVTKRRVTDKGASIDQMAAQQLKDHTYVDDSILGGSQADVDRMRGSRQNGAYSGTVAQILSKGAMTVKFMAVTGSHDPVEATQLGGKTLGVRYAIEDDKIQFLL